MNQIGIFLRVLLGLVVGFMSLIAFSLAPWALANVNFVFFGGGGITIFFGLIMGTLLGWIAFKLIAGAFRADHVNVA
jgi:hypothetical protein